MQKENYLHKDISYFINPRLDLISLMPINPKQKVLEVGMGGGDTLVHIKKQSLAAEVIGVDLIKLPGTYQSSELIDNVFFIDIENEELPFPEAYFDTIIAGDVFEHLIDPWNALSNISKLLKKGGCVLISLPNVRDIYALNGIIVKGTFSYTNSGIFDKTHMRFFCKKDMIKLIESNGEIKIEKIMPIQDFGTRNFKRKIFNKCTLRLFEEFVTSQYLFKAIKT